MEDLKNKNEDSGIWVLSHDFDYDEDEVRGDDSNILFRKLDPAKFSEGIKKFRSIIMSSIDSFDSSLNTFQLDEITLKIEINAEGKVLILGFGGKVGGAGGIQLKFTRKR